MHLFLGVACWLSSASGVAVNQSMHWQHIEIAGGTDHGNVYLSTTGDGKRVDLYNQDGGRGRQGWILEPNEDFTWYHIMVSGGVSRDGDTGYKYLSIKPPQTVDLYNQDDKSGRQRWVLEPIAGSADTYNIKNLAGNDKKYLSCQSGGLVDMYDKDDGSFRQRWKVKVDKLVRIEVGQTPTSSVKRPPKVLVNDQFINPTSATISKTVTWSETKQQTSSWNIQVGAQFSMGAEVKASTGILPGGEVGGHFDFQLSFSAGHEWSSTIETTKEVSETVTVAPNTNVQVVGTSQEVEADVPFTMVFESGTRVSGTWKGVLQSRCSIETKYLGAADAPNMPIVV